MEMLEGQPAKPVDNFINSYFKFENETVPGL